MSNIKNHKASNKENKKNDINRPEGHKGNKEIPPKFESLDGEPIK